MGTIGGDSVARLNRVFREAFQEFLKRRRLSAQAAAYEADLVVSTSALCNWRRGQEPTEGKVRDFFSRFDGEDVDWWVALLAHAEQAQAA